MKELFFKISLFIFVVFCSLPVKAQYDTIKDFAFYNWLNTNGYSSCLSFPYLLDTTCPAALNAKFIYCPGKGINNLYGIQYFDSLEYINCSNNNLTSLPAFPPSLLTLWCDRNPFNSITSLPVSLIEFHCDSCSQINLPSLPPNLEILFCEENQLSNFPALPATLTQILCKKNQFNVLPSLPPNLKMLDCSSNQISTLPILPPSLEVLYCNHNLLSTIPSVGISFKWLACSYNQFTTLPLIGSLVDEISIWCSWNQLTNIPHIPNLRLLDCSYNQVSSIDPNNTFKSLFCQGNFISSLSQANVDSVTLLSCSDNPIISLPNLPLCEDLYCYNSQLSILPILPSIMHRLELYNNPNLTCIPRFDSITYFNWYSTPILCLPNAIKIANAYPPITNLPICQPASGCNYYWNMFGKTFNDLNGDCIINSGELALKNIPLKLDSGAVTNQIFYSNKEGYYSFETGLGNYEIKIDTSGLPFDVVCPVGGSYNSVLTLADSLDPDLNFGFQCKPGYLDLISNSIAPSAQLRPGAYRTFYLNAGDATRFYGVSCANGISGTVKAILNGPLHYISAAPGALVPSYTNGDTILWNVTDFSLSDPSTDFNINIQVDTNASANNTICISLEIGTSSTEVNDSNNIIGHCFPIVNSFDPNAKEVYPAGIVEFGSKALTYTIYFQNTGNAPAENIYLLDTLHDGLDAGTFRFLSSSHAVTTQLLPGRILRFSFPGINLPDSNSNEPGSHGYVQFKIDRNDSLSQNEVITNKAYIYFDFNQPVITDDVYTLFNFDCNGLNILALNTSISDTVICDDEGVLYHNAPAFPFELQYNWFLDSAFIDSTSSINLTGLTPGLHQITLILGLDSCSISESHSILVYPHLPNPVISVNSDTLYSSPAANYQWILNGNLLPGDTLNTLVIPQSGWYSLMVSDSNGCSAFSDSVYVNGVGIHEYESSYFNIRPNPATETITVSLPFSNYLQKIEIFNSIGKCIYVGILTGNSIKIDVRNFSNGFYVLRLKNGDSFEYRKFIISGKNKE